jgi:hypothetical protein
MTEKSSEGSGAGRLRELAVRTAPIFTIVATLTYFFSMGFNVAPFAYYPEVGEFHLSAQPESLGPPMFWYAWILNGIVAGLVAAAAWCMLPRPLGAVFGGRLSWLVWAIPALVIIATIYFLRTFFQ